MDKFIVFAQTNIAPALESLPKPGAGTDKIRTAIYQVLITVGIIAVLMVVIGGVRYAASRGNPDQVAQAKNTIIYALIGLAVTAFATAIVRFVSGRLL